MRQPQQAGFPIVGDTELSGLEGGTQRLAGPRAGEVQVRARGQSSASGSEGVPGCVLQRDMQLLGLVERAAREERMHQVGDRPRHAGLAAALQEHFEARARLELGTADLAQPQGGVGAHDALPGDRDAAAPPHRGGDLLVVEAPRASALRA